MRDSMLRSPAVVRLYTALVLSERQWKRRVGLSLLAIFYLARSAKQFGGAAKAAALLVAAAFGAATLAVPPSQLAAAVGVAVAAAAAALVLVAGGQPDDGIGHRGGALGFKGQLCENTVEAAAALLERERQEGPLPGFPYLEIDVQETEDGEVVVFHDALLAGAFAAAGAVARHELEAATGTPFSLLAVRDVTLAQLQGLHLAGRPGLRVPTLQQYIQGCVAAGLRRTLAVEVKQLRTDGARRRLLATLSAYLAERGPALDADPVAVRHRCRQLGWAGVIAFPHLFAASFGEFGSPEWRRWAREFRRGGIPARACHALWLTLVGW